MDTGSPLTPRQGDATREALIKAAIDVFGRKGFEGATTRGIADAAGVNQALIGYHFNGKPGLYLAALEHIAAAVKERIGPTLATIEAELDGGAETLESTAAGGPAPGGDDTSARSLKALHMLTDAFVAMLTSDESAAWARLVLREQQSPSDGFDVLYTGFMSRVLGVIARLVAGLRDTDPALPETRLTALTIVGQALMFRAARAAVMRQMDWQNLGPEELARIQAAIRGNVAAMLRQEVSR